MTTGRGARATPPPAGSTSGRYEPNRGSLPEVSPSNCQTGKPQKIADRPEPQIGREIGALKPHLNLIFTYPLERDRISDCLRYKSTLSRRPGLFLSSDALGPEAKAGPNLDDPSRSLLFPIWQTCMRRWRYRELDWSRARLQLFGLPIEVKVISGA